MHPLPSKHTEFRTQLNPRALNKCVLFGLNRDPLPLRAGAHSPVTKSVRPPH